MSTLAVIALVWIGASVLVTLFVTGFLRVAGRAESRRDGDLAASLLDLARVHGERPVLGARALGVAARRPRG
ncbi:MAG: hypothetical protein JWN32_4079 [Solirubrobacterales bacterium]|nr:hypothetical protein [Solirubrobacterales bacterium]